MNNMDGYSFIASITGSLAWPLATVFIFNLVLKNLPSVTKFIKKIKYGEWEVDFSEQLEKVEEKIEKIPEVSSQVDGLSKDYSNELFVLVEKVDPTYAVIEGWKKLEMLIKEIFEKKVLQSSLEGLSGEGGRNFAFLAMLKRLESNNFLSHEVYRVIRSLSRLRNQAVHTKEEITKEEAYAYLDNLESVLKYLSRIQ